MHLLNLAVAIAACIAHPIFLIVFLYFYWTNLLYVTFASVAFISSFYFWIYMTKLAYKEWEKPRPSKDA